MFVATWPSAKVVTAVAASVPAFFASAIESVTSVANFARVTFASAILTVVTESAANSVAVTEATVSELLEAGEIQVYENSEN